MRSTHGGNLRALAGRAGRRPEEILDFSASINPLGPPAWLREELSRSVSGLVHYPDPRCAGLRAAGAARFGMAEAELVAGNGSTELLFALVRALAPPRAVIPVPAYTDYRRACEVAGVPVKEIPLSAEKDFEVEARRIAGELQPGDMLFLGRPANPTGRLTSARDFAALAEARPDVHFVADEAFIDFCRQAESMTAYHLSNVTVLYSLTKSFAVPGLRLGLAMASETIAAQIEGLVPPWSVNSLAQAVGERALADKAFLERSRSETAILAADLRKGLMELPGLRVFPSAANYMLCRLEDGDAAEPAEKLLIRRGIAIRTCADFRGLDRRYFRLAVRKENENERLLEAMAQELGAKARGRRGARRAPAIMVQGTGSNAGKSVIACALCRIFLQDGLTPAPFKAQNMSLNSFVTGKGEEMGRAQATQAAACRREPDVRMNPVLLKPGSDTGSQVIVMGRPVGNMSVEEYLAYKPEARRAVRDAYASLAAEAGVMVLEGAGSPAEINLKAHDIVNMAMARHARAGVLLAGDIDRGGVFAHFTGTMELLDEEERAAVGAFLINRFRGRESLLAPAMRDVAYRTGTPFAGVLPYLPELGLPEEDSVSFKAGRQNEAKAEADLVIACVDLPRISNFTDLDALAREPDARVKVLRRAGELDPEDPPDAIILPGSKNVAGDLEYLRSSGLAERILRCLGRCEIVGLCGGYQMLGEALLDPGGLESARKEVAGLGLLPLTSELATDKTLKLVRAGHADSGLEMRGYEIHHGVSEARGEAAPAVLAEDGRVIGHGIAGKRVWGTYLHGAFDADEFRRWFLDRLREHRGLTPLGRVVAVHDIEPALDRLAGTVRERLNMELIYSLAGL